MTAPETTVASLGTASSTLTTGISAQPVAPSYLVYGWEGVTRVHSEGSERLVAEPVLWAAEDGAGGIVFRSVAEQPGWGWLPADAERPVKVDVGDEGWPAVELAGLIEGRPSVVVTRSWDGMVWCEHQELVEEVLILDLGTGNERFIMCRYLDPDVRYGFGSYGAGLFTTVTAAATVYVETSVQLVFFDLQGQETVVEHNPFWESCAPCQLDAALSSDGRLLAYAHWPTAFWSIEVPDGDVERARNEWWEASKDIPTQIVVMDMATGDEVFRTDVVADATLTGFDGRIVTVTTGTGRELFDIESGESSTAPAARTELAAFWTVMLASLDNTVMDYDAAQLVASDLAAQHAVETGLLWSDGFVTLNQGLWAVFTGHLPTQGEAVAYCEALDTDCYPRYVATADIDGPDSSPDPTGFVLRHDGLGAVSFGDPVDEVMAVLTEHLGAPTYDELYESPFEVPSGWDNRGPRACHVNVATHGYICFDYIRFVGWEKVGLWALFSDIEANPEVARDDDGYWVQVPPSFQGYDYRGNESSPLHTAHGITVGSTAEDLMSLGPVVSFNWTPCGDHVEFTISDQRGFDGGLIYGFLDDQDFEAFQETSIPNENAKVVGLNAGQGSSC